MIAGCSQSKECVKPTFPNTTKEVGMKIKFLNDRDVDNWMVELYKLKLKLEVE
jgi:hypothetical protein